jgi:uncharacterized repeat protein (TIGR03803 family)
MLIWVCSYTLVLICIISGGRTNGRGETMQNLISRKVLQAARVAAPVLALALMAMQPVRAQTFTVLYTFTGGADGATPMATPLLYNGNVYGTTSGGGAHASGTVYSLTVKGQKEVALHSFDGTDGTGPIAGLVQDSAGNFFGAAYRGGAYDKGTLFELTPAGVFTLLHSFSGPPSQGTGPAGTLVFDSRGDLFGTTYVGGDEKGWGTVYEYSAAGVYSTGESFSPDGALPRAGLHFQSGKLYGTTYGGDTRQYGGTIYEVGLQGAPALYTFTGGADGSQPLASLIGDSQGNLYGTTSAGGSGDFGLGFGVVFKFNLETSQLTVLHTFMGPDGAVPAAALTWDLQGNLYGTTSEGGANGYGNVFELNPTTGNFTSLHDFTGGADGGKSYSGVIVDNKGNVWGAASAGGSAAAPGGYGTLFVITPPAS